MKRSIITLGIAVTLMFVYGCTNQETSSAASYEQVKIADVEPEMARATVTITATPTPEIAPEITEEPTPEPTPEPEYTATLVGNPIPEPEPEETNYDFYEGVQTGEYHEDIPSADSGQYLGDWTITFYCTGSCCNGSYTGTASGAPLTPWRTAACTALPFGTRVYIEGVGEFVIEDTGVSGNWIDCCVDSHQQALDLGMRTAAVYIVG